MIAGYETADLPIKNAQSFTDAAPHRSWFYYLRAYGFVMQGLKELGTLLASGKIKFKESIAPWI